MTLRKKTLIAVGAMLIGLMIVLYTSSRIILLSSFSKLEEQNTRESVQRAFNALTDEIAQMNSVAGDWARWDDTYEFIENANENFIKSNLVDDTFINLRLNLMVFVNSSDQVVFAKAFDVQNRNQVAVPQVWQKYLTDPRYKTVLLHHTDPQSGVSGIVLLPGPKDPFIIVARPIVTSEGQGPIRGTLILGRELNDAEIGQLARLTHLSLELLQFDQAQLPSSEQTAIWVEPLNDQLVAGYALVRDIYGYPAFMLRADTPRDIYHQGQVTLNYLLWWLLIVGLVFIFMTMLLWDQLALSRLARLSTDVSRIGSSGDLSARVGATGNDELSSVAGAINTMLGALQQTEGALRDSEARYRAVSELTSDFAYALRVEPDGRLTHEWVTEAFLRVMGLTQDQVDERGGLMNLIHPEDTPIAHQHLQTALAGQADAVEFRFVTKNGDERLVRNYIRPVWDKTRSRIVRIIGAAQDITERKRAEEALRESEGRFRQRAAELQVLYETSLCLSAQLEPSQLLHMTVEQAIKLSGSKTGGLYIYDPKQNQLILSFAVNHPQKLVPVRLNPGEGLAGQAFEKRHSITAEGYHTWTGRPDMPTADRQVALAVPLLGAGGVSGVLEVAGERPFDAHDIQLTELFAAQAAVALEKTHLYTQVQHRARELEALNKASQAMSSVLDLPAVLGLVISETRTLLDAEGVSVLLQDQGTCELVFAAVDSPSAEKLARIRIPSTAGVAGWAMQEKQAVLVSDAYNDPRFYNQVDEITGLTTRTLVVAPLVVRETAIGVVEAINKVGGVFDQHDVKLLEAMAGSAAIAAENARLFQLEKEQRELAETLREVGATLVSTLNTDTVLDLLLEQVSRVVPNDVADIMLIEVDQARIARWRGYERYNADALVTDATFPLDDVPNLRQMIETGEPVVVPNTHTDLNWIIYPGIDQLYSYASAPIRVRDKIIGFLNVNSTTPDFFGAKHAQRLRVFADQAAIALENARLYEEERKTADRLQALSRRLVEIQEMERSRIARELHDVASQSLTFLIVNLRLLEQQAGRPEAVAGHIADLKQMTGDVLESLHRLAADLRPASLDHLGLVATLRPYIETFSRQHNLNVQFEAVGLDDERLPVEAETALYRIVQEALTNVVRHANASRVDVILERRGDRLIAIIEDNGIGFNPDAAWRSDRLGLVGMRERTEMLGGTLVVESQMGGGTTILAEVPYVHSHPRG